MRPPTFSDSGDIIYHVLHILLFRFRNILVSHQADPSHFTAKLRLCLFIISLDEHVGYP